ncbi:MAG: hypothetical protein PHP85_03840 [Gallionella sp.]|nr:hypothetical protein [Gallionella sp.]
MNNPEFKRNLWLSFSLHRLIAVPLLLALIFLASAMSELQGNVADSLYSAATTLFIFIVWLWGTRNANAAIVDELRDRTWDQQRMSALGPWTMTWGKLFGSTSFNWYAGLMCLLVIATSGLMARKPDVIATLLTLCFIGVLLHAALIAVNLHTSQFDSKNIRQGGMGWLAIIPVFILIPAFSNSREMHVSWWGIQADHALFWLASAALFAACATFAAWRVMSNALQVRTMPWAWPALACILTYYSAGFIDGDALLLTGLLVSGGMTYAALFSEPNTRLKWQKLRLLQQNRNWRGWLENLPLWPTTLALVFIFALLIQLSSSRELPMSPLSPGLAIPFALMILRDACILLFFSFSPNSRRAASATVAYLMVLDLLLPFVAGVAGLDALRYFFFPFDAGHGSTLIMILHSTTAIALVNWRLKKTQ